MGSPDAIGAAVESGHPVILFDGVCNLCNTSVQFIINHDPKGKFRFAALQSDFGQRELERFSFDKNQLLSVVLILKNNSYDKSRAALEIARRLSGLWPLMYAFIIVPPFIRDFVYNWISRNRYRWFGRKDECMIPTPDLKAKFIN